MQNYEIENDFLDQRQGYLRLLITATFLLSLLLLPFNVSEDLIFKLPWVIVFAGLLVANLLRRRKFVSAGSWVYVLTLTCTALAILANSGPSTGVFFLLMIPIALAALLIDPRRVTNVAAFVLIGVLLILTVQSNVITAIGTMVMPGIFCFTMAVVLNINEKDVLDTVHWATDIQQKDAARAEMFYQQREQLSDALRQLTHAHVKLESMNFQLSDAQRRTEQASNAKSVFLSNMSHELRTPLNVIIGYTTAMLDIPAIYNNAVLPSEYLNDIHLIKDNGYYLLGLVNDILDLSKIEAGKLELHQTSVKLEDILKGTLSTAIGLVKDKPIQVRPDYTDNLPNVWADPTRVRQIILNLMSNAIKFTKTGSVTLQARLEGDQVRIAVIDTGVGIPEKALAHIFDRFEQAEKDTDKQYGGTGLGLDISRQLVRMHGGDLTVQSAVGKGSTFSFTLEVTSQQQAEEAATTPVTAVKTLAPMVSDLMMPYTILLVEDEASLRDMMQRTLESAGHVVVALQDGGQVIEAAVGLLPDLIILDVRLPNVDGWSLLQQLKDNVETASLPVVVATGSDDEGRAADLGAALYIRKPFSADELLACAEQLLPSAAQPDGTR